MSLDEPVIMKPIGYFFTAAENIPRHWSLSEEEGRIVIDPQYVEGLVDIEPGQEIVVLFCFDRSPAFASGYLRQTPPHRRQALGVFSTCSPRRPNPIGLSVVRVLDVQGGEIRVKGIDMLDGTPVLDIKPHIINRGDCPSHDAGDESDSATGG